MKLTIKCECGNETTFDVKEITLRDCLGQDDFHIYNDYDGLQITCKKCNETNFI